MGRLAELAAMIENSDRPSLGGEGSAMLPLKEINMKETNPLPKMKCKYTYCEKQDDSIEQKTNLLL